MMNKFILSVIKTLHFTIALVVLFSACDSKETKKIKFHVNGKKYFLNWDEDLYIDRIFETKYYIDLELMYNSSKDYVRHRVSIGDLDRMWLLDSSVYPSLDNSDNLLYNYYSNNPEYEVSFFERSKNEYLNYLMFEYYMKKGRLSAFQSQSKVNDSLDIVIKTIFRTNELRERECVLTDHKYQFNSVIGNLK